MFEHWAWSKALHSLNKHCKRVLYTVHLPIPYYLFIRCRHVIDLVRLTVIIHHFEYAFTPNTQNWRGKKTVWAARKGKGKKCGIRIIDKCKWDVWQNQNENEQCKRFISINTMFVGGFAISKMKSMMVFNVCLKRTENEVRKTETFMNYLKSNSLWMLMNWMVCGWEWTQDNLAVPLPFGSEHVFAQHFNNIT